MDSDWKPDENDVKEVLEAHGLIPSGPLLEEALGLVSLYENRLRKRLEELPSSVNSKKALMAFLEEGFMQEGLIPNNHKNIFEMPAQS
jgi:hypothetical protein